VLIWKNPKHLIWLIVSDDILLGWDDYCKVNNFLNFRSLQVIIRDLDDEEAIEDINEKFVMKDAISCFFCQGLQAGCNPQNSFEEPSFSDLCQGSPPDPDPAGM
jgi:hypothetical protein